MRRGIVSGLVGLLLSCTPGVRGTAVTKYRTTDSLRTVGDVVSQEQKDTVEVTDEGADILGAKHDGNDSNDAETYVDEGSHVSYDASCSDAGDAPDCYTADIPRVDVWIPPRVDAVTEAGNYEITKGENTAETEIYTAPDADEGDAEVAETKGDADSNPDMVGMNSEEVNSPDVAKDTLDALITPGECLPSEYQPVYGTEAWKVIPTMEQNTSYAVWGKDEKNVFFAGGGAAGRLLQYDGKDVKVVVPDQAYSTLYAVWGIASKVYAAGVDGDTTNGLILEIENGTITKQINQGIPPIRGIWGPNIETVYFVGGNNNEGVLLQLQGDTLEQKEIGPVSDLTAIWGSSAKDFYITGYDATLLRCTSESCNKVEEILKFLSYTPLRTIHGTGPQDVFVGGQAGSEDKSGSILHFDSKQWTKMNVPNTDLYVNITGIWAKTPQEAYATDAQGNVYHYNGCDWQIMADFPTSQFGNFWEIWGAENGELFVAGSLNSLHYKPPQ
ncbi:hypothetical protein HYX14_01565 [Candidatus Woesearchaeota archaeon]|nr:hypothetical protein [Candidatus Woesearchaeota archaeon]